MSNVVVFNLLLAVTGGPLVVVAVWFTARALVDPGKPAEKPEPRRQLPAPVRKELTR